MRSIKILPRQETRRETESVAFLNHRRGEESICYNRDEISRRLCRAVLKMI